VERLYQARWREYWDGGATEKVPGIPGNEDVTIEEDHGSHLWLLYPSPANSGKVVPPILAEIFSKSRCACAVAFNIVWHFQN
jgi:hypothetical protein